MEVLSIYRQNLDTLLTNGIENNPVHPKLAGWMRKDFPNITIGTDGAKGNRQIGRLMFANAYSDIRILLFDKLEELYTKSQTGKLDVIIVSSVAGGTGSGILADITYNIRAFAKSRKWKNFRVGGCLLMPDVLFGKKEIYDDKELVAKLNANACATMKEIDYLMHSVDRGEPFVMECMDHRLSIIENIFDACMLVSGKKDEQGYIPEHNICSDTAYFLFKLACNKYIGIQDDNGKAKLLRDVFFESTEKGGYKIVNESDYRIPIREIENICEYEVFSTVYEKMLEVPVLNYSNELDIQPIFAELREFLLQKPGEEIRLPYNGLIRIGQFERPTYKMIKKGQDNLRNSMANQLRVFREESNGMARGLKSKMIDALEIILQKYMQDLGPFAVMEIIGAAGVGKCESDSGIICEIKKLGDMHKKYEPTGEFSRIIDSIKDIVAKRFFTFPSAKRETENGYYDACVKETLALERNIIMEAFDSQDVFGDVVRWLRQRAERLNEIYYPFGEDLKNAVYDLAATAKNTVGYLLKDAKQQKFLPSDYITEDRLEYARKGIINLMINHEADIDNARVVPVKQEMEKIYRDTFMGIDLYAPEKLISVAFADELPTLQDTNMMFVTVGSNEKLAQIMNRAAEAFVRGAKAKVDGKKLCILKKDWGDKLTYKRYISLPDAMPHFSEAIKLVLMCEPYNEKEESISFNSGEI
ncbi:MAG: tubulin-like doman-containing protein, partial [Wujia sp.]